MFITRVLVTFVPLLTNSHVRFNPHLIHPLQSVTEMNVLHLQDQLSISLRKLLCRARLFQPSLTTSSPPWFPPLLENMERSVSHTDGGRDLLSVLRHQWTLKLIGTPIKIQSTKRQYDDLVYISVSAKMNPFTSGDLRLTINFVIPFYPYYYCYLPFPLIILQLLLWFYSFIFYHLTKFYFIFAAILLWSAITCTVLYIFISYLWFLKIFVNNHVWKTSFKFKEPPHSVNVLYKQKHQGTFIFKHDLK